MDPKFEALVNLIKDEEAGQKLMSLSAEEAVSVLKTQYDLDFSVEELNDIASGMKCAMEEDSNGELSEANLESVAGGANSTAYNVGYYVGKGVKIFGTGVAIAGGIIAMGW